MPIGSGLSAQLGLAEEVYTNEVQSLTTTGVPTGGTFTLNFNGAVTTPLQWNDTAVNVAAALNALPNIGAAGVACAGGVLPTAISITFQGPLVSKQNVPQITIGTNSLTGGASPVPVVSTTTPGTGYGDYVAPTRFLEFVSEGVNLQIDRIKSGAIRSGQRVARTDRWVANKIGAAGDLNFEVASKGFGLIWKYLLGTAAPAITTPTNGVLTRKQSFILGDPFNQSLSAQIGRPDTGGTVRSFSYLGSKVTGWELACALDQIATLKMSIDAQDEDTSQTLGAASYASAFELLNYTGGLVTIAGANFDIQTFSLIGAIGLNVARRLQRQNTKKKQPILNVLSGLTGSFTAEFTDMSAYTRFTAGALAAVTITLKGSQIENVASPGPYNYQVVVTLPNVRFDGDTPNVANMDIVPQQLPFEILDDGASAPITIDYYTTDTAI